MDESTLNKTRLVETLIEKGFSVRQAMKAVNGLFEVLVDRLRRGESVGVPGGTLRVIPQNRTRRQTLQRVSNIHTGKTEQRLIAYGQRRRVIRFTPDPGFEFDPPQRQTSETQDHSDVLHLTAELLERPVTAEDLALLHDVVTERPTKPGNLLLRLREIKQRGFRGSDIGGLAQAVRGLYWI